MHESEKWKGSVQLFGLHGLRPTRLLHPWDFPGKSAGVRAVAFSIVWINTHLISVPYSALIWLHILPIPFHCYCHTNCIHIASLCTVYLSTRVYNYCFMKLCFIRCRKELWKTIYIVFCIAPCSYLSWCSLFLSVNLNYCLVSFHLSLKLSLCYFLQGRSAGNEFCVFVYQRMF